MSPAEKDNLELLIYRLEQLEKASVSLEAKMDVFEKTERSKLLWGVMALGTVVMTLGGVLWTYRAVIFRGAE